MNQKASERHILLALSGLVVLILGAVWMMVPRIRPGSRIDAAITILLVFSAYAILLFAVLIWKGKIGWIETKKSRGKGFISLVPAF